MKNAEDDTDDSPSHPNAKSKTEKCKKTVRWEADLLETITQTRPATKSLAELTECVIREIQAIVDGRIHMEWKDALFFQVVCGGNVLVARSVFEVLREDGKAELLAWITEGLDQGRHKDEDSSTLIRPTSTESSQAPKTSNHHLSCVIPSCRSCDNLSARWIKVVLFVVICVFSVLITPVFYIIHAIAMKMFKLYRKRIVHNIRLPLMFALLSEEVEMVRLFLDNGCRIGCTDCDGNNAYHYLADMSLDDPDKAFRCHEIIISLVQDVTELRKVITRDENTLQMTAWESMAKFGSLALFRHIAMDQCGIGSRILSVSQDLLWAKLPAEDWTQVTNKDKALGIMADPETPTIVQEEHKRITPLIDVWELDTQRYNEGDVFGRHSYPLQLVTSRSVERLSRKDAGSLLTFTLLWKWMESKRRRYLLPCLLSHAANICLTITLLMFTVRHGGDMQSSPLAAPAYMKYSTEINRVSSIINEQSANLLPVLNLTLRDVAETRLNISSCVLEQVHWASLSDLGSSSRQVTHCMYKILVEIQDTCETLDLEDIIENVYLAETKHTTNIVTGDSKLRAVIYLFAGFILTLDCFSRLLFLYANFNWGAKLSRNTVFPIISRAMPGSYLEKQMNLGMVTLYFMAVHVAYTLKYTVDDFKAGYVRYNETLFEADSLSSRMALSQIGATILNESRSIVILEHLWSNLIILCLLLRFILLIYSLRLLPYIGIFVITAKKMAIHLAQFAAIFFIVSLAFATMFYLVMKDPKCPALRLENFTSIMNSLFTIYQVFLGYGEYDFTVNVNARLAYIAFTVTTVILLLNLVIAVMTTTVEELSRSPWKQVLCLFERWNEILGTEASVGTLLLPIKLIADKVRKRFWVTDDVKVRQSFEIVCWSKFEGAHSVL